MKDKLTRNGSKKTLIKIKTNMKAYLLSFGIALSFLVPLTINTVLNSQDAFEANNQVVEKVAKRPSVYSDRILNLN